MILHASGATPAALFEDAAQQLFRSLTPVNDLSPSLREKISIDAESPRDLLQYWITELLRLTHEEHMLFQNARILAIEIPPGGRPHLQAELLGELIDPMRHTIQIDLTSCFSVLVELKALTSSNRGLQALLQIKP